MNVSVYSVDGKLVSVLFNGQAEASTTYNVPFKGNNLPQGMINSFFEGSKQTTDTTPDGLPPVEVFTTNPNILRVADTGRGSGEPILQVD